MTRIETALLFTSLILLVVVVGLAVSYPQGGPDLTNEVQQVCLGVRSETQEIYLMETC